MNSLQILCTISLIFSIMMIMVWLFLCYLVHKNQKNSEEMFNKQYKFNEIKLDLIKSKMDEKISKDKNILIDDLNTKINELELKLKIAKSSNKFLEDLIKELKESKINGNTKKRKTNQ